MPSIKVNPEFYLNFAQYQGYSDKATDWFIKSFKYKFHSPEWWICRMKMRIWDREAMKHLNEAARLLNNG